MYLDLVISAIGGGGIVGIIFSIYQWSKSKTAAFRECIYDKRCQVYTSIIKSYHQLISYIVMTVQKKEDFVDEDKITKLMHMYSEASSNALKALLLMTDRAITASRAFENEIYSAISPSGDLRKALLNSDIAIPLLHRHLGLEYGKLVNELRVDLGIDRLTKETMELIRIKDKAKFYGGGYPDV